MNAFENRRAGRSPEADSRWAAVVARDAKADGLFFVAVKTTGIYCRPSCPSRRPRPENVRFHATAAGARRAGFRACKRCHPDASLSPSGRPRPDAA